MKILEVAGTGGVGVGYMGPITTAITYLANSLAKLPCEVSVADARTDQPRSSLNLDLVELIEIDSPGWPKDKEPDSIEKFVNGLSQYEIENYDIIHVHDYQIGTLIKKKFNIDCVYTSHTPLWAEQNVSLKRKIKNFILRTMTNHEVRYIKSCKLTIALGSFLQNNVNGENIKVIPNGTDLTRWNRDSQARLKLGISKDDFIVLFIGRLDKNKGSHVLIEAARQLNIRNLKIILIGKLLGDDYAKKICSMAEGFPITFAGFVSNRTEEFLHYLSVADILVVPSFFDNQPTTVLEGLSMGVPVIGSNSGGIPDMLNPKVGLLFEPGNAVELAGCIKRLYEDNELRTQMSKFSRQYIQENYTWDVCANKYLSAFSELLVQNKK